MRCRYERRDPRQEDLRQIDELKSMVDSQEKDIFYLTEQLRELQLNQQQEKMQNHQNQTNQQNANQSKKNKSKNNKNISNNRNNINNISSNGNSDNNTQQQTRQPQTQQNANHERDQHQQRTKPPPLIKTIIYEEENENELYEEQIREERENAMKIHEQVMESEMQNQQDGVMVELVPESPDYATKHMNMEEISEAHIVSNQDIMNNIPDVLVSLSTNDKLQEIRVEVISTIEPANIQIVPFDSSVCNGHAAIDPELD